VLNSTLGMLGFVVFLSIYIIISLLLFRFCKTKSEEFNYLFLLPSVWVIGEWLRGWVFTGFSWCDIAYTQVNNYLLQGVFPVLGSYGVSWFAVSIIGFLFYVLINNKIMTIRNPKITLSHRLALLYFVVVAIAGYYMHGIEYTSKYGEPIKISLIQGNVNGAEKWDSNVFLKHLDMYSKMISNSKADITILPETAFPLYMDYLPVGYLDDIKKLAEMNNSALIIGMPKKIDSDGNYVNSATVVTESGYPYYAKSHLVPFGEYIPMKDIWGRFYIFAGIPMVGFSSGGVNQAPLVVKNQKLAFNLCYENGFGSELINAASQSTLMVNLSDMVWYGDTIAEDQHLQLSQARALENQRYFIQDTNSGLTTVIDPYGHIEAQLPSFTQDDLITYVQGRVGQTPYQKYGNYLIIIFSFVMVGLVLVMRRYFKE
jgi:apolipoprotein N-acyltransferase